MPDNGASLYDLKCFLEDALQVYERAHTRGEFHENVFQVHAGLDYALTLQLGQDQRDVPLPKKLWTFMPNVARRHRVVWLNTQRNELAHYPWQVTDASKIYETSHGLVNLAQAAWFGLFNEPAPPVRHPLFDPTARVPAGAGTQEDAADLADWAVQPAGFAQPPGAAQPVYQVGVPAPLTGAGAPAGSGPTAPISSASTPAVLTRPLTPARASWRSRWLPVFAGLLVLALVIGAFFLPSQDRTAQPAQIGIGSRVQVTVQPNEVLLLLLAPETRQPQSAHYLRGAVLEVTGGPFASGDMTWWKVRGQDGEGWTVANFLMPIDR